MVALDGGPQTPPKTAVEARAAALMHLDKQEVALRSFLAQHAEDGHVFEARLRLARLLQIRGDVQGNLKAVEEGRLLLDQLAVGASPEQRTEVDFAKLTLFMRTMRGPTPESGERLLDLTRLFQKAHPNDRRIGGLLAEVATLFELKPKTMRGLLMEAERVTSDAQLRGRIADDLKRLDLLGHPVALSFTTLDGKPFDVVAYRGKVVWVLFFARWSQPSLDALDTLKKSLAAFPPDSVRVVALSLDVKTEPLQAVLKEKAVSWPVGCDAKGWESPLIRAFGINSLPTAWLLDKKGVLRSLNVLESTQAQTRQLLEGR